MTPVPRPCVHVFDAFAAAILALGVAGGAVGYRALRGNQPKVDTLEPAIIRPASATRVRLSGRDLRPFLQVFVLKAGVPFVLHDQSSGYQQATFFLASAREAEIESPALASGVYDVYLFDQGQQVAMLPAALRVESAGRQPSTMAATVRFLVPPEIASLIQVGDHDGGASPRQAGGGSAEVRELALRPRLAETVDFRETDGRVFAGAKTLSRVVDVTLAVPVTLDDADAWVYHGAPVRAGEDFTFATGRYVVSGTTVDVEAPR